MKALLTQPWPLLLALLVFTACGEDEDLIPQPRTDFSELEDEWVRLTLLRDNEIELIQANTGASISTVAVPLTEGARYYTSNSGRYLVVTERADNRLRFFDSGVVNHEDHGHQEAVGWLDMSVEAPLPTHYAGSEGHIVIFNDGDGSITYVNEAQLELPTYTPRVYTFPTVAHHGAGFRLRTGQFVTTFKEEGAEPGGLPQMVKFLDTDGSLIDENGGVVVGGIHGDAVNGNYGVFGSTDGVILVDGQRNIELIPNTEGLRDTSGFWIGTLKGHDDAPNFFGRARSVGTFMIDPQARTMTPLYEGADVVGDMMSFDGDHYIVHTDDNRVRVYSSTDGSLVAERTVEMMNIPDPSTGEPVSVVDQEMMENDPVLRASDNYLYILGPSRTDIKVLDIETLEHVHTITLDRPVDSIAKNGFTTR